MRGTEFPVKIHAPAHSLGDHAGRFRRTKRPSPGRNDDMKLWEGKWPRVPPPGGPGLRIRSPGVAAVPADENRGSLGIVRGPRAPPIVHNAYRIDLEGESQRKQNMVVLVAPALPAAPRVAIVCVVQPGFPSSGGPGSRSLHRTCSETIGPGDPSPDQLIDPVGDPLRGVAELVPGLSLIHI